MDWNPFKVPEGHVFEFEEELVKDPNLFKTRKKTKEDTQVKPKSLYVQVFTTLENERIALNWEVDLIKESVDGIDLDLDSENDPQHVIQTVIPSDPSKPHHEWFKPTVLPTRYWMQVRDQEAPSYRGRIISWFYDAELKLFVIKRYDGCQFLKVSKDAFNSLPETDFDDLAYERLVNPEADMNAMLFEKWIRNDKFLKKKNVSDKSKYMFHPRTVKRIIKPDGTAEYRSGKIKCVKRVPLKKWKQDILDDLDCWRIDYMTGEAFMLAGREQQHKELLRMYDPLQLINLSRKDLRKLDVTQSYSARFLGFELERYKRVIKLCLKDRIHANSKRMLFEGK